ncbi:glycosyltransferase family 4 protein [Rhodopseudomonas palustris]|nr:glycosyltransferase family 4 protein [Rhodopseudomonas palustris]
MFRPMLLYWGRRGLSRLVLNFALSARTELDIPITASISRRNEIFDQFYRALDRDLIAIDIFATYAGAATQAWRIPLLRQQISRACEERGVTHIIDMMPHLWMPFIVSAIQARGVCYIPIVHDANVHPGDIRTRLASVFTDHLIARADHLVTLSQAVSDSLRLRLGADAPVRISTLFHPDLTFSSGAMETRGPPHLPPRLLFLGRILPYKGLPLFTTTIELLRAAGFAVDAGVFGEGAIGAERPRLLSINAEVVNRWLSEADIAEVLARYDVVIASHLEASQSGIVAAAHGAGLPVVTSPVGGLIEQVDDGHTGLVARATTAEALGDAIRRLFETPGLYAQIQARIAADREARSITHFARRLFEIARSVSRPS